MLNTNSKIKVLATLSMGLLALNFFAAQSSAKNADLLIENVTLISAERSQPLNHASVLIRNGEIIEVSGQSISKKIDTVGKGIEVIDGTGRFLIPGLMDSHVHVSNMPGAPFKYQDDPVLTKLVDQFHQQQPRSYLYFGVTQVLDPSQSAESITRFNRAIEKPDLFHCGAIPIFRGYPALYVTDEEAASIFDFILADKDADHQHSNFSYPKHFNPQEHTPEKLVAKIAKDGAICVKVFIEDGFGSQSHWPLIAKSALERIRKAADKHGLKMVAHANAIDMQTIALEVGVDVIAHGMWNWNQYDGQKGLPQPIKNIADKIVSSHTTYQATFGVMDGLKGVMLPETLNKLLLTYVVPAQTLDWYRSEQGQWFHREMKSDYGDIPLETIHRYQDLNIGQGERVLAYLDQQNHPLVLASDTPAAPTYAQQPGYSTYMELRHMHKIGISLSRIFAAATLNNAKQFNLDNHYGSIEPGKKANLLLLEENPLNTIEAYNSISQVVLGGKVIDRNSLSVKSLEISKD